MQSYYRIMISILGILCLGMLINPLFSQTYQLTGKVYQGDAGMEPPNSTPIPGVPILLFGANSSGVKESPSIDNTTTDGSGWYSLEVNTLADAFDFYIIEEVDKSGYTSVGATTVGGTVLTSNRIEYTYLELINNDKTGNKFWDKPTAAENTPPTAEADGPYIGVVGQSVSLDGSGSFDPDAGDHIVSYTWDLDGDGQYDDATGVKPGHTWYSPFNGPVRLRVTDTHGASDSDGANVTITEAEEDQWDFGDAPEMPERGYHYPTTLANNGARHKITRNGPWLGSVSFNYNIPDAEPDGQPDIEAEGDNVTDRCDECSCVSNFLLIGMPNTIGLSVGSGGIIDLWVDLDQDGTWQHPAERIFSGFLPDGYHKVSVTIPDASVPGSTYMRVRISTAGGLTPEGPADDGEVVDEKMNIYQADFGDLPNSYKGYLQSGIPINEEIVKLGSSIDSELKSQPGPLADGDDINGIDDEDGVRFLTPIIPGKTALVEVVCTAKPKTCYEVSGYLDFHGDGRFDQYDNLFWLGNFTPNSQTVYVRQFMVPNFLGEGINPVVNGPTYARFRITAGQTSSLYFGEIEDYMVTISDSTESIPRDHGDAPCDGLNTFYPDASHELGGPWLGGPGDAPDAEPAQQKDPHAEGDDQCGKDDENCIVYANFIRGQNSELDFNFNTGPTGDVVFTLSIDWNFDGDWEDSGEFIAVYINQQYPPNSQVTFKWPFNWLPGVKTGKTFGRIRIYEFMQNKWVTVDGPGQAGEVEDFEIEIKASGDPAPPGAIVYGSKWHDLDGNRQWDAGEPPLPGWTIWLDLNHNGIQDAGDPVDITDASGGFEFTGLSAGQYTVCEKPEPGWIQTWPGAQATQTVTADPQQPNPGIVFGNRLVEPDSGLGAVKWSQPPLFDMMTDDTTCYSGWPVLSGLMGTCIADDWFCHDFHPVTSIRWWGSYSDWDSLFAPPEAPIYFRIGVWTDFSGQAADDFSHPQEMIREWFVSRQSVHETVDKIHFHPEHMDRPVSCFRYTFYMPHDDWFYQQGDSAVQWLSVQPVYSETDPAHAWGWLTRERYFNGDAIRVLQPFHPDMGSFYETGVPVAGFQDLAFELGTDAFEDLYDFGDAPDIGYGTAAGRNGPRHLFCSGIHLGESIDTESGGQPDPDALGDDNDGEPDEDGVLFLNGLRPGEMAGIQVTASAFGLLNAWVDFNLDSTWNQPEEHVLTDIPVSSGTRLMEFPVAELARSGGSFARFRFSTWPGIRARGFAPDGEVEDYRVFIGQGAAIGQSTEMPSEYRLCPNRPNPFNPCTRFRFEIPFRGRSKVDVEFRIYNLRGQLIRTLIREERSPGIYETSWDGLNDDGNPVSTGIYLYRLHAGQFIATKKLILMK
ncbi:T9SS type A sorting domain-containing protein [bacterium]|nr:T9SS type A sorting domain-containing protein [bacterium]